jgi:2'-5' RNA ligase
MAVAILNQPDDMSHFRTFIAIEIGLEVKSRAAALISRLRESGAKVSWTRPENLHLTLKFLGDTPDTRIPEVCRAVAKVASRAQPITIGFRQAGAFPKLERPRTLWIGVEEGMTELLALQENLEDELAELGFPRERRRFSPHLTIGRVRSSGPSALALGELLRREQGFVAGETVADEIEVMASFLSPQGPTYQLLSHTGIGA